MIMVAVAIIIGLGIWSYYISIARISTEQLNIEDLVNKEVNMVLLKLIAIVPDVQSPDDYYGVIALMLRIDGERRRIPIAIELSNETYTTWSPDDIEAYYVNSSIDTNGILGDENEFTELPTVTYSPTRILRKGIVRGWSDYTTYNIITTSIKVYIVPYPIDLEGFPQTLLYLRIPKRYIDYNYTIKIYIYVNVGYNLYEVKALPISLQGSLLWRF